MGGQRVKVPTSKGSKQYSAIVVGPAKRDGKFVLRIREGHPRQMTPEMQAELSRLKAEIDRYRQRLRQRWSNADYNKIVDLAIALDRLKPAQSSVKTSVKAMPIESIAVKPLARRGKFEFVPKTTRRKARIETIRRESEKKYSGKRLARELKKRGIRPKANRKGK